MTGLVKIVSTMGVKDVASGGLGALLKDMAVKEEKLVGVIHGTATGVSYRSNKFGDEPSKALTGQFEGVSVDPEAPLVRSARLFLPNNIQSLLVAALETGIDEKARPKKATPLGKAIDLEGSASLPVKVMVSIRKTDPEGGGAGYEFISVMPDEPQPEDALADSRQVATAMLQGGAAMKALPAPKAKAKAKGKK